MVSVNLIGRLTSDPTTKDVNGSSCCSFTLASDTAVKDKDGKRIADFYRVTAWGKLGDVCAKFLKKGDRTYASGDLRTGTYVAQDGSTRLNLDVTARDIQFVGAKHTNNTQQDDDCFTD